MSDMGNVKVKHIGGSPARKPSLERGNHPMQKPGDAMGNPSSMMRWEKREINASKPASHMKK